MSYNLVIVESSTKANVIAKYLNDSEELKHIGKFQVIASQGHVRDISKKQMGIDMNTFDCNFVIIEDKKKIVGNLKKYIDNAKTVYLAADNDREGEGIAWHLREYFRLKPNKYKRILFNEITKRALVQSVLNPVDINRHMVDAYLTRRILDRFVGFMITKLLWKSFDSNITLQKLVNRSLNKYVEDVEFQNEIKSLGNDTKVHISPGNHEVGTGPYNAKRDLYIKNFGKTFKFFRYESDLFILLDANSHYWNILDNQLQMLKDLSLKKAEYRNVFIFSHQVIWADSNNKRFSRLITNSKEGKAEKLNFWNDVFPLIKDLGKNVFFFSGDVGAFDNDSEFFYDNISNVDFFATGMGGGKRDNFLILHVNQGNVEIELIEF